MSVRSRCLPVSIGISRNRDGTGDIEDRDLPKLVSRLRVLDVLVWMRHRREHRRTGCPGFELQPPDYESAYVFYLA